jgi:hypothetical protein
MIENYDLKQDLWDYTTLLDLYLEDEDKNNDPIAKYDDLSTWIVTIQSADESAMDRAIERWQATRSDAWLVAALTLVKASHAKTSELITQALNVKPAAAAFPSARFHAVRLMMETGKSDEARALLDQLLKNHRAQFDESSFNLLLNRRMLLASTLDEFLKYAPRVPAAVSWNDDGREIPADDESVSNEMKDIKGEPRFDRDAGMALNEKIPLSLLKAAAQNTTLPAALRRDLAQAVWLRAAMLGDTKTADELVPVLSALVPELSTLLNDYLSATTPQAKKFAAIYAWLKFPGMEPVVDVGIGRRTPLNKQDEYRDNWWCSAAYHPSPDENESENNASTALNTQPLLFLSAADKANAEREWKALNPAGAAPNYIVEQVIQWANKTPADSRVPEALHLAVTTTRFGCTDEKTGRWSKAAFDLLHRKYPNSPWARKTKYWFNN